MFSVFIQSPNAPGAAPFSQSREIMSQSAFDPSMRNERTAGLPSLVATVLTSVTRPGNAPYMAPMRVSSTVRRASSIVRSASRSAGSGASTGQTATVTRVLSRPM